MEDKELSLDANYSQLCKKLSKHRLPRWNALPDIELYMDQVVAVMERFLRVYIDISPDDNKIITPSIINNYVKLKVIPAPAKKRYSKTHLAYLLMICILKQTLSIQSISKIIERQMSIKPIDVLYDEFCNLYESIIPFINISDFSDNEEKVDSVEDFVLKSAILSTTGKFICEGILSAISSTEHEEKVKEKQSKEKSE